MPPTHRIARSDPLFGFRGGHRRPHREQRARVGAVGLAWLASCDVVLPRQGAVGSGRSAGPGRGGQDVPTRARIRLVYPRQSSERALILWVICRPAGPPACGPRPVWLATAAESPLRLPEPAASPLKPILLRRPPHRRRLRVLELEPVGCATPEA